MNPNRRVPMIVCEMCEWPSGFVQITTREGTPGVTESANGEITHAIPQREFFGAVSARHHGDIDAETADARATREAFRAAAHRYGYTADSL